MSDCLDHFTTSACFVYCRSLFFMKIHKGKKVALIWGAETVLGRHLVDLLLLHPAYAEVKVLVKKELDLKHEKLSQFLLIESNLEEAKKWFSGNDLFLCASKYFHQSFSKKRLHNQNLVVPAKISKMCLENGANQVFCLSSFGASEKSPFFHLRVIGALEQEINKMNFWSAHFFRPVFMSEKKESSGFQKLFVETVDEVLNKVTGGNLNKLKPMYSETIAQSMVSAAQKLAPGTFYHTNEEFQKIEDLNKNLS